MTVPRMLIKPLGKSLHVNVMQQCRIEHLFLLSFFSSHRTELYTSIPRTCLPIVYHPDYNITFMGLEKLHPFDAGKWGKVIHFLKGKRMRSRAAVRWGGRLPELMYMEYHSEWIREAQRGREQRGETGEVRCSCLRGERQSNRAQIIRANSLWEAAQVQETRPHAGFKAKGKAG